MGEVEYSASSSTVRLGGSPSLDKVSALTKDQSPHWEIDSETCKPRPQASQYLGFIRINPMFSD